MPGDDGLGGGKDAREVVTCPTGYKYLGKLCVKYHDDEEDDYDGASADCDPDMLYVPTDQDQAIIFREALTVKVIRGKKVTFISMYKMV